MKKILTLVAALSLVASLAVGGSIAYLQDTDEAVNVMTLGNVYIDQIETDRLGNPFEQNQPIYPIIGEKADVDGDGYWDNNNVIDKKVTVTNTGSSDAYVRTLYAFEIGTMDEKYLNINWEPGIDVQKIDTITIEGEDYLLYSVTYPDALAPNASVSGLKQVALDYTAGNNEVEAVSGDSVYQILVVSQAVQTVGFEAVKDANGNITKPAANHALDTAFGEVSKDSHPWLDWNGKTDADGDQEPDKYVLVNTLDDLKAAMAEGGSIKLTNDITFDNMIKLENGVEVTLDLNGKTIDFNRSADFNPGNPLFYPLAGTKLTITGNGTVNLGDNYDAALLYPAGEVVIENGTFIKDRVPDGMSSDEVQTLFMGVKSVGSSVVIKDGYFDGGYYDKNADLAFSETDADMANRGKAADKNAYRTAIKDNTSLLLNLSWSSAAGTQDFRIYGGTFVGANPAWGDEGCAMPITPDYLRPWSYYQGMFLEGQEMHDDKIELPDGYTITESKTSDGRPVFTVNYNK